MKKVSVIVPCYNAGKYIDRCLKSLTQQTIGADSLEIFVVDDLSQDDSRERVSEWEKRFPETVAFIPLETHVMQGAARNIAIGYALGEYLMFLDADDWLLPEAVEHIYEKAVKSGAEIVGYLSRNAYEYDPEDREYETGIKNELLKVTDTGDRIKLLFSGRTMRGCWDKLYKRSFVLDHKLRYAEGVFDEESLFTIPAFLSVNRYYLLNEELHRYYENHESTVFNLVKKAEHRDDNARTWFELYHFLKDEGYLERDSVVPEALFIQNYFNRSFLNNIPRGLSYDAPTVKNMQDTVRAFFPDYENNPVLLQMRSLGYTKRLMDFDTASGDMGRFDELVREFAANVGNEL
ncbi:MAG: glycosyltransferase family 2 protein [Lachnospiraceae bacterium]|nr:glycosyltransferase family 2 protein [Lachnospiraceae bacterium]